MGFIALLLSKLWFFIYNPTPCFLYYCYIVLYKSSTSYTWYTVVL